MAMSGELQAELTGEGVPPDRKTFLKGLMIQGETSLAESGDYRGAVGMLYMDVLGRDADDDGLTTYASQLESGRPLGELRSDLATSDEFRTRAREAAETNREAAVGNIYLSILGRTMDDAGKATYATSTELSIDTIIDDMLRSDEYRERFLTPTPPEDTQEPAPPVPISAPAVVAPGTEHINPPTLRVTPEHRPVPPAARAPESAQPEQRRKLRDHPVVRRILKRDS
jgi:hypothetical protein